MDPFGNRGVKRGPSAFVSSFAKDLPCFQVVVFDLNAYSWMTLIKSRSRNNPASAEIGGSESAPGDSPEQVSCFTDASVSAAKPPLPVPPIDPAHCSEEENEECIKLVCMIANQIFVFLNTVLAGHEKSRVVVIGCTGKTAKVLFPGSVFLADEMFRDSLPIGTTLTELLISNARKALELENQLPTREPPSLMLSLMKSLHDGISSLFQESIGQESIDSTKISGALSLALCLVNRAYAAATSAARAAAALSVELSADKSMVRSQKPTAPGQPGGSAGSAMGMTMLNARILVVCASPDSPGQYVPLMNCIFSSQRLNVPIDTLLLRPNDGDESKYFQQAGYLTGGIYLRPLGFLESPEMLLQLLMGVYLVDPLYRSILRLPTQREVDFRATCFVTKKTIQIGWTCSVCLSCFANHNPVCPTCGVKYKLAARLPPLPGGRGPS